MAVKVLVITPDYTLNGANIALLELLDIFKSKNYHVHCIGHENGVLADSFKKVAKCQLFPSVPTDNKIKSELINNYDFVFLNSSSVHLYTMIFQNTPIPVYWWFHEGPEQLSSLPSYFPHLGLLSKNFHFLSVTPKVKRGLLDLFGVESRVLEEPIKDCCDDTVSHEDKIIFYIPAAYIYIKGQDILIRAINRIPPNLRQKCKFIFSGYQLESQKKYYDLIVESAEGLDCVEILGPLPRDEVYAIYKKSACVIAPSRIDSANATIMEGLMFTKISILSDGCGISEYLTDCVNAFIFPKENEEELYKRILLVIAEHENLNELRAKGRGVYEEVFHPSVIKKKWEKIRKD